MNGLTKEITATCGNTILVTCCTFNGFYNTLLWLNIYSCNI